MARSRLAHTSRRDDQFAAYLEIGLVMNISDAWKYHPIERIARILAVRSHLSCLTGWTQEEIDDFGACHWRDYESDAKVVIESLEWPLPDAVMKAGGTATPFGYPLDSWTPGEIVAGTVWREMVRACLYT